MIDNAVKISRVKKFFCTECQVKFIVDTRRTRVKGFCPCCGDCISTERYQNEKHNKKYRWSDNDFEVLKEFLKQDLIYKEIAAKMGKTHKSIEHFIYKHRKELLAR